MKKLFIFALCITTLFSTTSCFNFKQHSHSWSNYLIKTPSCTQKGLLERLCADCGEKTYEDIEQSEHYFMDGTCLICGASATPVATLTRFPLPSDSNNDARWSMQKIYDTLYSVKLVEVSYEEFLRDTTYAKGEDIYMSNLGLLHFTAGGDGLEAPLALIVGKVSPKNPEESQYGSIQSAELNHNELVLSYNDGRRVSAGTFDPSNEIYITGFAFNENTEFVVYYSNNTIAFAGTVLIGAAPTNQAKFTYFEYPEGYSIVSANDKDSTVLEIPISHRGKPIISIDERAFADCNVQKLIIPETVEDIDFYAFLGNNCPIEIYLDYETDLNDVDYLPNVSAVYSKETWSYIDGIPTLNN
ncbi:MAG: hypothetical protein E7371_04710 [Clostridiales bacterium]|nr:hypothetical protein [Clostridiales bacterium]